MSFALRAGEIGGLAGVAGQRPVANCSRRCAGIRPIAEGEILIDGVPVPSAERNPLGMGRLGLVHVPEDRHRMGLVTAFEAAESAILGIHREPRFARLALPEPPRRDRRRGPARWPLTT